ncbi:2-polyprenyl-3-methyl-5-hydroxy-6-metoxy-1,4-benzoquinol methylase [Anaerosolibacter carboniphilus]|uniref:2-polyprenyl-3-methyl-5-hydroxy-6-metoxy-1, 4-benzoquinol methylase n=1 Tax=Anaerosolibacter carboniphilus TaxID=1417629 RepID=A0A841KP43_9FIRM|nr:2-polyprenyl-3-methyl-5-hydroxy-6-metoxy-1,4-benzoquinol methylase [Anaerosolibacter carboniphilus]
MKVEMFELGHVQDEKLKYAVIAALFQEQWVFVRHKERDTWEIPGGRREQDEDINTTASRELFEESGAEKFTIKPICDYSVTVKEEPSFGRLFFAEIEELGDLPELEIGEVRLFKEIPEKLTYPKIQSILHKWVLSSFEATNLDKRKIVAKVEKAEWNDFFRQRDLRLIEPEAFLVNNVHLLQTGSVLDIACGDGRNAIFLATNGFQVKGIDFSSEALERMRYFAEKEGTYVEGKEIDLRNAQLLKALDRFDNIIINHYKPTKDVLNLLPMLLNEKGILLICTFNYLQNVEKGYPREFCLEKEELVDRYPELVLLRHESFTDARGYFDGYIFQKNE